MPTFCQIPPPPLHFLQPLHQLLVAAPSGLRPPASQSPFGRPAGTALTGAVLQLRLSANPRRRIPSDKTHVMPSHVIFRSPEDLFRFNRHPSTGERAPPLLLFLSRLYITLSWPICRKLNAQSGATIHCLPFQNIVAQRGRNCCWRTHRYQVDEVRQCILQQVSQAP